MFDAIPIYVLICVLVTFILGRRLAHTIAFPLKALSESAKKLAIGDPDVQITYHSKDEVGELADAMRALCEGMQREYEVLSRIASGELTDTISVRSESDMVTHAVRSILQNHNDLIREIKNSILQVSTAASEVANGAQNLASGSNEQAAAIEEFSAILNDVNNAAVENAGISDTTLKSVYEHANIIEHNIEGMRRMSEAMQAITESSTRIATVIKVIDDIAFQTNILALNAAVEAARAGQHGKGFAVVADAVRELASKSAEAAKETAALIEHSLANVQNGNEILAKTTESNIEIERIGSETSQMMRKMSESSVQQSQSIQEINTGIVQISSVIQANSAMAEESAAAAETMAAQMEYLQSQVEHFKLYQSKR
ncbi:MAG: methyl-accepting chemotaxis protein [Clostridiales Family XIII bacterium]|jgi:methyl-accepting chemotaxis protein|nr:methyl-accepting chemotaxis protein [Clostridiales Family XIII bacterium]